MANKRITELTASTTVPAGSQLLLARLSPTVKKTATTISFAASDKSINDSGNGLVTAGFAAGDQVKVTGAANGANNVFSATATVVGPGKMVTNAAFVNEAAGASVTVTKWESVRVDRASLLAELARLGGAPVVTEAGASRDMVPADAGAYVRFVGTVAKTATFDDGDGFAAGEEFHLANRGATGTLTLVAAGGMTLNPPAGGTLDVPPGGTVMVKIVAADEADVVGTTEDAP